MTHETVLEEIQQLRSSLLLMDSTYRATRNRYTPVEIADALKALRRITLSIEAHGMKNCFIEAEHADHATN